MNKIYIYDHLQKKSEDSLNNVQYTLTDEVILSYLNSIVTNANKLTSIVYTKVSEPKKMGEIHITFKLLKEYPLDT